MRLGIDASNLRQGGGVTHLSEVLKAATPEEFGISRIVVWSSQSTLQQLPTRPWLELVHEPLLDRGLPYRVYWQHRRLTRLAARSCDILYAPGGGSRKALSPYIVMSRNLLPFEFRELRRFGFSWFFFRLLLLRSQQLAGFRRADGLLFLTQYAREVVTQGRGDFGNRVEIIPHGINEVFRLSPRPQRELSEFTPEDPFRILYVSIVNMYKHQWSVAEAVAMLRREGLPVVLDLVGPSHPAALARLRKVIDRHDPGETYLRYRGPVPHAQLHQEYHRADAFTFASSCENMPHILMEAMAAGLPIACSNRGPMPEILGDAGIYYDPEDPAQIASALRRLVTDRALREQLAQQAYNRALQWTWDCCMRKTFTFISGFAPGNRVPLSCQSSH